MNGSFNGIQSPYTFDHGEAYNQRQHEERRRREERQQRAEQWIAARFAGKTFTTLESFENAACALCVTLNGGALDVESHKVIVQSCRSLFAGLVDPEVFRGKIRVVRGQSITFLAA